jgi:hypothetical protein
MLKKFSGGSEWILPLLAHASVHGAFTLAIVLIVNPSFWWLAFMDLIIHFTMDRIKASPDMLGKYKQMSPAEFVENNAILAKFAANPPRHNTMEADTYNRALLRVNHNKYFWWALGLDQAVHHLTHYLIIFILIA